MSTLDDAWMNQAFAAIAQGQNLNQFMLYCHPDNRAKARKGYKAAQRQLTKNQETNQPREQNEN